MGDQGHFQRSPYNTPHQRLSSSSSIGSQQSFPGEESPQDYQTMQPVTLNNQMPLRDEMNNLHLLRAHSQSSLSGSDSFDVYPDFDDMSGFEYTEPQAPLIGDPNVLRNQQNNPNYQPDHYATDYEVNQPQMHQMTPNDQNEGYNEDERFESTLTHASANNAQGYYEDDRFESTLTHASANNAPAVTTHPQQTPMMVYSNLASQEPQPEYYYQAPHYSMSAEDYSNQGAGDESDTSQRSIRRGRTSRSANRPYDRAASRSTSRNSNHSQSSLNQSQPAGRGRPALYKIDLNNLTESQMKSKKEIEDGEVYRNKATENEKCVYLLNRLKNIEATRNSRSNKNIMLRDVLNFGEELYHAAQHVRQTIPGVENVESLLEKIERWEIVNKIYFVEKVNDLTPKLNEDNDL
ncbi:unnamed protein product, partial [Mesorhabditis belari]|uniref:Uncharacterized protein n=1 Tax=Mesorhabditis belari TaxID=2138241 RepID=A0AAF3EB26_9BILA